MYLQIKMKAERVSVHIICRAEQVSLKKRFGSGFSRKAFKYTLYFDEL
jgi:hypothetical protein